jgi:proteasome lid subunit RPN8/RPN11
MNKTKRKKPKTVEEDLAAIDEKELLKEDKQLSPRTKRIIIFSGALLIIVLFLSLAYLQYPLFHIIEGQIESDSLNNNILDLKEFKVVFSDTALQKIRESYTNNPDVETSLCLLGARNGDYYITDAYTPVIYEQSFRHVSHAPCNTSTIIMFHTHPYKSCVASETDLNTLHMNQLNNPNMLTIVMCEPNRFSVYG